MAEQGQEMGEVVVAEPVTSQDLVRLPGREVLMPLDTTQIVAGMQAYQRLLHELLSPTDWQETGERDKNTGQMKKFPKKSAWRKIARAFNLSITRVDSGVEYEPDGIKPIRAWSIYRATAPNGVTMDGDGYCTLSEFKGKRRDDVKLENAMRATATTRAKNRATSDLVGMGEVSAEEMQAGAIDSGNLPSDGPPASEALVAALPKALAFLFDTGEGPNMMMAAEALAKITSAYGYVPAPVAWSIATAAGVLRSAITPPDEDRAPDGGVTPVSDEVIADAEVVPDDDDGPNDGGPPPLATDEEERRAQAAIDF